MRAAGMDDCCKHSSLDQNDHKRRVERVLYWIVSDLRRHFILNSVISVFHVVLHSVT
jgi:hypothetical protein